MFCDRCGTALPSVQTTCHNCGRQFPAAPATLAGSGTYAYAMPAVMPASRGAADRLPVHLNRLAGLWLANGALRLLEVLGFWTVSRLFDWMDFGMDGLPWAATIWGIRFSEGAMFLFGMFGVLHLVLAWGLFQRASWARYLGVALGFLALFRFPLGTALGVYTLWVLLPVASAKEYERISQTA